MRVEVVDRVKDTIDSLLLVNGERPVPRDRCENGHVADQTSRDLCKAAELDLELGETFGFSRHLRRMHDRLVAMLFVKKLCPAESLAVPRHVAAPHLFVQGWSVADQVI
jgi:hypothetical protein